MYKSKYYCECQKCKKTWPERFYPEVETKAEQVIMDNWVGSLMWVGHKENAPDGYVFHKTNNPFWGEWVPVQDGWDTP